MTTIQGNVSLMLFDIPVSHPNYQNLINIEKQIQSGTRLTSQLLGFAKQGKYQLHSLDINNLVENKVWQPAEAAAESMQGCGTILLVDDEASVLNVGVQLLGKLGYEVIKADSGRKAVKLFEENQDNIDLVISDMVMPGMNGGEVFDRIRQIKGDANFLLASGYSADGQASEILNRGCNGFIQKPFTLKQLARKIREVLVPAENRAKK
jgi:CheY-like chemotaxis protein